MPVAADHDIVIVSDLHMSSGYSRRTGTYDRNEDFFYDAAFSRFIDHLLARAKEEDRRWRLVLLGDLVDFLQVDRPHASSAGLTSNDTTLLKLEIISKGHAVLFAALGRLLAAGHRLDVVLGNHDIEFVWPDVQDRFKQLLAQAAGHNVIDQITFHPWILYVPGMLYAEHGQQYDGVNSFTTLLKPFLPAPQQHLIELPLGSFFVLYLFNYIERIDPFADNIKPVTRYLGWALRAQPLRALSTLGYHARFFIRVLGKTSNLSAAEQRARREQYRAEVLTAVADEIGLPFTALEAIDKLAAIPALANRQRQLEALLFRPFLPALPWLGVISIATSLIRRLRPGNRSIWTFLLTVGMMLWRERRLLRPAVQSGGFLLRAAREIHEILEAEGRSVPAYVFGHTHITEQHPFTTNDEAPRYFNTGTWTPLVPQTFDLLSTRERFTFVQITRDRVGGRVVPELLLWNDAADRSEPLPLLTI